MINKILELHDKVIHTLIRIMAGFASIVMGVWILPQLPEHIHFWFAIGILALGVYFMYEAVSIWETQK